MEYGELELQICRRDRGYDRRKPGCRYNLPKSEFKEWKDDLEASFPGITISYSEDHCLGLCPCSGISIQLERFPTVVHSLREIKQHINAYIQTTT